ncbi:hypothetical protein L204_102486 [Cryptococcus depauperatus]|nr:hypothetical protein L204_00768 [Cryptococcus depauperatus CBS 7855]
MADEKKPWLGCHTIPELCIWVFFFFNVVGVLALVMLIICEFVILVNNAQNYHSQYGYSDTARGYRGEAGSGYVEWTNAPKHTGSVVWMVLYQLSIVVLITIAIASDLAWRASSYNAWGGRWIATFHINGVADGPKRPGLFFYLVAHASLKTFIVVLYMNQSFYGMKGTTSHKSPFHDDSYSSGQHYTPVPVSPSSSLTSCHGSCVSSASSSISNSGRPPAYSWKRRDFDPADPLSIYGVEAWVYYTGWIVLASIIPSLTAFVVLEPWGKKKAEEKKDVEKSEK